MGTFVFTIVFRLSRFPHGNRCGVREVLLFCTTTHIGFLRKPTTISPVAANEQTPRTQHKAPKRSRLMPQLRAKKNSPLIFFVKKEAPLSKLKKTPHLSLTTKREQPPGKSRDYPMPCAIKSERSCSQSHLAKKELFHAGKLQPAPVPSGTADPFPVSNIRRGSAVRGLSCF